MSKLEGRVALVTGGARGMGEAHARALIAEGAEVVIGDVLEKEGAALADELGGPDRIRVNSLHPGIINTPMIEGAADEATQAARYPIPRSEVAATMLHIVCDATYSTGSEFCVDGGILAGISVGD